MFITRGCSPYVGYYLGLEEMVSFTETTAEVLSYKDPANSKKVDLKIPYVAKMAFRDAFKPKRRIRWLLREGYVPLLRGAEMTFVKKAPRVHELRKACQEIRKDVTRNQLQGLSSDQCELLITLLDEFTENVEKKPPIALLCIEKAFEVTKAGSVERLLADSLFYLKSDEACYSLCKSIHDFKRPSGFSKSYLKQSK